MKTDGISPTADIFIASLYSAPKNEPILRSLLNAVMTDIGEPAVTKATVLNPFNIQAYPADKQIRLDVLVEDEAKAFYNVEVQVDPHTGFFDRMLYYWAEVYGSLLEKGEKYNQLLPVRTVIITEFPVFPMLQRLHAVFELRSRENPDVLFSRHCQIHVLRLGDLIRNDLIGLDQFGLDLQRWLQFWALGEKLEEVTMSAILQDCPPVQAAYGEYRQFAADPAMREKARARKRFLDEQVIITAQAEARGAEKERQRFLDEQVIITAQAEARGAEKERQRFLDEQVIIAAQAEARGAAREKTETALNLKRLGIPVITIAEATGLSQSEIERLE